MSHVIGSTNGESLAEFIEGRKSGERPLRPSDLTQWKKLDHVFHREGLSVAEIANEIGVSAAVVRECLNWHGLSVARVSHRPERPPWSVNGELQRAIDAENGGGEIE